MSSQWEHDAWREGANHHPVAAVVLMPRRLAPHVTQPTPLGRRFNQEKLLQDLRQPVPPLALQQLRQEAGALVTGVDNAGTHLLQVAEKWYPRPPRPDRRPDQPAELANSARHMWDIFKQMRQYRRTAQGIVSAWKVWVQFQKAHRIHKQRSKQRTKQKRDDLLEQAQQSARAGNLFGLWKVVKQLAPKAPRRRLQLHKDGQILSPDEELQWIVQAYGDRYGVGSSEPAWTYQPRALLSEVVIDASDLADVLSRLHPRKAVPRNSVPPVLLKACCSDIAPALASDVNDKWSRDSAQVNQEWSDANVALLPKAHGRSRTPVDWRPIGLQDCLGKSVMTLLLRQARQALVNLSVGILRQLISQAGVPAQHLGKSSRTVTMFANMLKEIGSLSINERRDNSHHSAQAAYKSAWILAARWGHIKDAMDLAGVPLGVQDILLVWLAQVRCVFNHRGRSGTISPRWGLRQGCIASPLLRAAFTSLVCTTLEHKLGTDWPRNHATL